MVHLAGEKPAPSLLREIADLAGTDGRVFFITGDNT